MHANRENNMFNRVKVPRDEETERLENQRKDGLIATALHMLDAAVERHDDAMERGCFTEADDHSEHAAYWWGALTGRNS